MELSPSVRRIDKMATAGVLDKVDKIDKVDPEAWTRLTLLTLLTPAGRGILMTNETQYKTSPPQFWDITKEFP